MQAGEYRHDWLHTCIRTYKNDIPSRHLHSRQSCINDSIYSFPLLHSLGRDNRHSSKQEPSHQSTMKLFPAILSAALAATVAQAALSPEQIEERHQQRRKLGKRADAVVGSPEGFASSATGGASGSTVYPTTTDELVSYLGSSSALTIVLAQTFDFTDTEGTVTSTGCAPWGTASACQLAINQNDWCDNYESDAPSVTVEYYAAATLGITVTSDKSIIGSGSSGVIKGRGLRIVSGASNVIIQNIEITDLNPRYVWGGDAITLDDCDLIWIDVSIYRNLLSTAVSPPPRSTRRKHQERYNKS